ncbi:MAG: HmuY family protein [Capnocytophaga granulosa]
MKLKFLAPALLAGFVAFTSCSKEDKKEPKDPYEGLRNWNVPVGQEKEVKYLDASNNEGKYVYFSFEKGVVEVADPVASNDWDIAFNRYHVKTNSGTSGKGQGGALRTEGKDFAALKEAPTEGYLADVEKEVSSYTGGKGGNKKISLAPALDPGHGEGFWEMIKEGALAGASKGIPGYDQLTEEQKKAALAKMEQRIKPTLIHNNGWLTMDYKKGSSGPSYTYNNWVYVVKTAAGKYAKVQLTDYKDAKDQAGFITFKYLVF